MRFVIVEPAQSVHTEGRYGQRGTEIPEPTDACPHGPGTVHGCDCRRKHQLFEKRFDAMAESFNRWIDQQQKVTEVLKDYDKATSAYLAAIVRK